MNASPSAATRSAVLSGLVVLAACSGSVTTPGGSGLSQAEIQAVGDDVAGEVAGLTSSLTLNTLLVPTFSAPVAAFAGPAAFNRGVCPAIAPLPPLDSDGDQVPDSVTVTFTLPDCRFGPGPDGGFLELTGSVTILDPSTTELGLRVLFNALQEKAIAADASYLQRMVSGVRQLLASAAGFSATDSTLSVVQSSGGRNASLDNAWQVDFAADSGLAFVPDQALPSGSFTIAGTTIRTGEGETLSFSVATPAPLHYNSACAGSQKIDSGTLRLTLSGPRGSAVITLTYTACDVDPTAAGTGTT